MYDDHEHVRTCVPWSGRMVWCESGELQEPCRSECMPRGQCVYLASSLCCCRLVITAPIDRKWWLRRQPLRCAREHARWHGERRYEAWGPREGASRRWHCRWWRQWILPCLATSSSATLFEAREPDDGFGSWTSVSTQSCWISDECDGTRIGITKIEAGEKTLDIRSMIFVQYLCWSGLLGNNKIIARLWDICDGDVRDVKSQKPQDFGRFPSHRARGALLSRLHSKLLTHLNQQAQINILRFGLCATDFSVPFMRNVDTLKRKTSISNCRSWSYAHFSLVFTSIANE